MKPKYDAITRPYTPVDPPGLPMCGVGEGRQVDIHVPKPNPKPQANERIELLSIPTIGSPYYSPELIWLAKQVNKLLTDNGLPLVEMQRQLHKEPSVELTISLERHGIYLSYARSATNNEIEDDSKKE